MLSVGLGGRILRFRPRYPRPVPGDVLPPALLVIFGAALFFQGIGTRELWASHEARAAQNAQRVLDGGDWLLPRLYDGQVELQKPPGFYWLVATAGWLRDGVDPYAVRLPAALAGTLTVLMVWRYLHRRGRPLAAFVAGACLASAVHFTGTARIGRIDVPLACAVTAIMLLGRSGPVASTPRMGAALTGLVTGVALLLKGPVGVVLPATALMLNWQIDRVRWRDQTSFVLIVGAVALAIAAPWFLWANRETHGEWFRVFFLYHHMNRAFGGSDALAGHPWWFYLPRFAGDFLPWTPLVLMALWRRTWRGDPEARFGLVWLAAMVAVLSLSRFKRADYLLPAYAGAAIFLGCALERWYQSRSRRVRRRAAYSFAVTLALLPAGWLVFDHLVTSKEEAARAQASFARRIREAAPAPQPVLFFRAESHLLAYHLGRPVHTLVEWSDLGAQLQAGGRHFVVTRAEYADEVRRQVRVPCALVVRSEDVTRGSPHRPLVVLRIDSHGR